MAETFKPVKDIKTTRSDILNFIKEQLQIAEGGEGGGIKGLKLFIHCAPANIYIYESALYHDIPSKFKEDELQRIADDYDINLPEGWKYETSYNETPPPDAIQSPSGDVALLILTERNAGKRKSATLTVEVLCGETEKKSYAFSSTDNKFNIGRGAHAQTAGGFFRKNHIAFTEVELAANRSVSRQHAHIEWNPDEASFILYADEGGIPPSNKMKVKMADGQVIKLQAVEIGHKLSSGDQVILGEEAVLEFTIAAN